MTRIVAAMALACWAVCFQESYAAAPDPAPVAKLLTPEQILNLEKKDAAGIRARKPAALPAKAPAALPRFGGTNAPFVGGPPSPKKNPSVSGHLTRASRNASAISGSDKLQSGGR
jgi:hypothetical protein